MEGISLLSGGKDSIYAMYIAMQHGIEIRGIVNILPEEFSLMYHFPNAKVVKHIAESVGIEFHQYRISDDPLELLDVIESFDEPVVISGAIASEYQKTRIDMVCTYAGKVHYAPLWRKDPFSILHEIIHSGFRVIFVSVSAEGLGENLLGREIDENTVEDLRFLSNKYGIHPSGEGGEYETLVIDGPIFRKKLSIRKYEIEWKGSYGIMKIEEVDLLDKDMNIHGFHQQKV